MKKFLSILIFLVLYKFEASCQERLLFLGVTKNYISKDSTNFSFNFDLNRIPGGTEKVGGTFFMNRFINKEESWRMYIKPSIDVNLGTGTTTAPNNVNLGIPIGFSFDEIKLAELSFEASPEFVADKNFDNFLYYGSVGVYFKVESKRKTLLDISTGMTLSYGKRSYSDKGKQANNYGRLAFPLYVKFALCDAVDKTDPTKHYFRVQLTNTFKLYNVYKDNETITPDPSLVYNSAKIEFYFIPRLAISVGYNYGYEEPLFKKINSLSAGLTFARF